VFNLELRNKKKIEVAGVYLHPFLTSELGKDEWSASRPSGFNFWKNVAGTIGVEFQKTEGPGWTL
jgi:hypothetical protein